MVIFVLVIIIFLYPNEHELTKLHNIILKVYVPNVKYDEGIDNIEVSNVFLLKLTYSVICFSNMSFLYISISM